MNMEHQAANREAWLNDLAALMAPAFAELEVPLPAHRIAVGFPSNGIRSNATRECCDAKASADNTFEVFMRPNQAAAFAVGNGQVVVLPIGSDSDFVSTPQQPKNIGSAINSSVVYANAQLSVLAVPTSGGSRTAWLVLPI